jgi:prepilin-type N-terminal cleavage/methylation domain-containing protein
MQIQHSKQSAFSLIELSIVLVVIGLLLTGTLQGSLLIRQSKLKAAKMVTQNSPVIKIKNLAIWYDATADNSFADSPMRDGAEIALWRDVNPKASSGIDLVVHKVLSNPVKNPSYLANGINGLPSVSFVIDSIATSSISNDSLKSDNVSYSQIMKSDSITIFLVENSISSDTHYVSAIEWGISNDDIGLFPINKDNKLRARFGSTDVEYVLTGDLLDKATNDSQIITMVRQSSNVSLRMGGDEIVSDNNVTDSLSGIGRLMVGGFKGDIGEIIIFRRGLKNSEIAKVEEYLSKKWRIALVE